MPTVSPPGISSCAQAVPHRPAQTTAAATTTRSRKNTFFPMLILPIVFVRPFSMGHTQAEQPFKNLSFLPLPPKPAKRRPNPVFSKFFPTRTLSVL
jgi:hypothetical protein